MAIGPVVVVVRKFQTISTILSLREPLRLGPTQARSKNKMIGGGGGLSEWPTLTPAPPPPPPRFGPSVKAYLPAAIVVDGSKSFSFPRCSLIRIVS